MKPMLAHKYEERGKSIRYPAFVQPKLDGIRVVAHRTEEGVNYYSRLGNKFNTLDHFSSVIMETFPKDTYLDGEAYIHGTPMQHISHLVKRDHPTSNTKLVQYWVYDLINPSLYFVARNRLLQRLAESRREGPVVYLPACEVKSEADMKKSHAFFTQHGFEGTIIRNSNSLYCHKRTVDLQKFKDFQDEEFEIIGTEECTGKDTGMIKFRCITNTERAEFSVEPAGSDSLRRRMWAERETFQGKRCTVKFQGYYVDGTPRFPTAAVVRDYE